MNRYIFKNMIKPVALVTSVGIAMQVPFNVWASKAYEEQLQQIADANGDVGLLLDNIPGLKILKDEGVLEKSEENKYIAVSGSAASVNEVDSVYKLMRQVNSGNLSNIDVADLAKKNSGAYSKVEKLKNVVIDIAVNTVLKEANLKAGNDINTKPNENIVTVMKLTMEASKDLHYVVNDVVINAGKKKTPQNSFIGGKVENLVFRTADAMRSSRGGRDLSQEDLQGIRGAVEDLSKGVEIKKVADEMVNRNMNVAADAAVTEIASNQVATAIEQSGVDSQNVEAIQNVDAVKNSVKAIADAIERTDDAANKTIEDFNKQLEEMKLKLQQALEKNERLASELEAQKKENESKTKTIEEKDQEIAELNNTLEELNNKLNAALQGKTNEEIAELLEKSQSGAGNGLTDVVGKIQKTILAMDYTASANEIKKDELNKAKSENEDAKKELQSVTNKATSKDIKEKKDYADKLVAAKTAELNLLEVQKEFNQQVENAIKQDFKEKMDEWYKDYDTTVINALIEKLGPEIIKSNAPKVDGYDTMDLVNKEQLNSELEDAQKKLTDCELKINQDAILEKLTNGEADGKDKETLLKLQTEKLKTAQPTPENATIETTKNYKTYADKNLLYKQQQLKNNQDSTKAKTEYLKASYDVEIAENLAKIALLNEEKKYIAGKLGMPTTQRDVRSLNAWLKNVCGAFTTVLGTDKEKILNKIDNDREYKKLFNVTYKDNKGNEIKLAADNTDVLQFGKSAFSLKQALDVRAETGDLRKTYKYNGNNGEENIKPIEKEIEDLRTVIKSINEEKQNIVVDTQIQYTKDELYTNIIKSLDAFLSIKEIEYKNEGNKSEYNWFNTTTVGKIYEKNDDFRKMVFYILLLKDFKDDTGKDASESYEQFIDNVLAKKSKHYQAMLGIVEKIKKANGYESINNEENFIKSIFNSFKRYMKAAEDSQRAKIDNQEKIDEKIGAVQGSNIEIIEEVKVGEITFGTAMSEPPPPPGGSNTLSAEVKGTIGYSLIENIKGLKETETGKNFKTQFTMKTNLVDLLKDKNAENNKLLTLISTYVNDDDSMKDNIKSRIDALITEDKQTADKLIKGLIDNRKEIKSLQQKKMAATNDIITDVDSAISDLKQLLHNEQDDLEQLENDIDKYFSLSKKQQLAKEKEIRAKLDSLENSASDATKAKIKELRAKLNLVSQESNTLEDLKKIYTGDDEWLLDKKEVSKKLKNFVTELGKNYTLTARQEMQLNGGLNSTLPDEVTQIESVIGEDNVKIIKVYYQLYEYLDKASNSVNELDKERSYQQIHRHIIDYSDLLLKQLPIDDNQDDNQDDQDDNQDNQDDDKGDQDDNQDDQDDDEDDQDDNQDDQDDDKGDQGNPGDDATGTGGGAAGLAFGSSSSGLATDKELSALLEGSNTMSEEQFYECLYNIVLSWLIEGSINCVQVGDQVAYKEIVNMVSKAKQVFTSGKKDAIEDVVLFALKTRLKYIEKYTPYYTASGLLAKYFSADGTVKQGVDESADVLKKVAIVDFLYAKYSLDSSFNIANISNVDNVVKIIQSLQTTLYTNKCVPTNDFFDSIIYKDVEKKQVDTECIGNLNLVAAAMVFSDVSKVEGKSGLNKVMNTLISYPVYDPDASSQNDWRKSCEQVLLELEIGS